LHGRERKGRRTLSTRRKKKHRKSSQSAGKRGRPVNEGISTKVGEKVGGGGGESEG